ncbi:MAG: hypothetical protein RJA57_1401 [Bacteroidota bacterium]|jgi:SAM-dependent methyltransferase
MISRKEHWEAIYAGREPHQRGWTQARPTRSLELIHALHLPKTAAIIDVGGGDSRLVDHLLDEGYQDLSVLDISTTAIERAQARLGDRAAQVKWIIGDVTEFRPSTGYDCWHDRAVFHFLLTPDEIGRYLQAARESVRHYLVIGTFSENGPPTCSQLPVHRYSEESLTLQLAEGFEKLNCITEDHMTPFQTRQHFLFCTFKRLKTT